MKKKILSFITLLCMITALLPTNIATVFAATSGTCGDNVNWTLSSSGTLTISGTGKMLDYSKGKSPWYSERENTKNISIGSGVTYVGAYAFYLCNKATKITIGENVTSIGSYAFSSCNGYSTLTIPASVKTINANAFNQCNGVTDIYFKGSVNVGDDAFYSQALKNVYVPSIEIWREFKFSNFRSNPGYLGANIYINGSIPTEIVIPDGTTTIGAYAYYGWSKVTKVTIPESIKTIGTSAFSKCSNITDVYISNYDAWCNIDFGDAYASPVIQAGKIYINGKIPTEIKIPEGTEKIKTGTYSGWDCLTNIELPDTLVTIEDGAFYGCDGLTGMNIPQNVTTIGERAFYSCEGLKNITIPEYVTKIGDYAFAYCHNITNINYNARNCADFTNSNLYATVYGGTVFYNIGNNSSNIELVIGDTVERIPKYFMANDLSGNNDVYIGKNVTTIDDYAFYNSSRYIRNIDVPYKLKKVGNYAFYNGTHANIVAKIRYNGLAEDWDLIDFGSGNDAFKNLSKEYYSIVKFIDKNGNVLHEKECELDTKFDETWIPQKEENLTEIYSDAEMTSKFDVDSIISKNTNIYVKYIANQYTYKFVDEDGTVLKEETVDYGAEIIPPENPSKESTAQFNYTFTGWDGYTEGMTQTAEELVFYATYSVATNKYTYKFVDEDGTVLKEKTVNYNTMITAPTSPTKDATAQYTYTFEKWDGFTLGMKITQDVTFTAVYNATTNRYTYKFVEEDGSTIEEKTIDYGTEIVAPDIVLDKAPTDKYTYTHTGWNGYTSGMTITENITFTPIFDSVINKYSYKFVDEDGTVLKEDTVDFDTVITAPENPNKEATQQYTYTFIGWDGFNEGITQKAEAMVFTAKYSEAVNKYTYKFVDDNGATLKELTVDYGTEIAPPENPSKAATDKYTYTFSKWNGYSTGMTITDNVTFTAEYTASINKYTYKFIDYDGSVVKSGTIDYGTVIPTPVTPNSYSDQQYTYVFASWKGYVKGTKITKDVEFTARYSPIINQYTYVFADENGNTLAEETVDYGTEIIAPDAPQKPSTDKYTYVFSGWNGYTDGMTLTDDVIFTPIYTPVINKYMYKFVDDDGSVIEENTVEYDSVITAPENPTKNATKQYTYTFIGWDGFDTGITQKAETMVFTAKYKETLNQYTYKFVDEDGTALKEETADYGTTIVAPENPTKGATAQYSYTFTGWNGYTDGMTLIDDITFTAVYSPITNKYTYKFVDKDGATLKEDTVDYGTTVIPPEDPDDKDPFTFDYWENYTDNMVVEREIVFNAIYKYKKYTITISELEKSQEVTYGDSYTLPIQEIKDFVFKGYYTEENGKGVKLTDENGKSIENYAFAESKTVYPYYVHSFTNKVMITGTDNTQPGTDNILQTVAFATDKAAKSLTCTVKYPEKFKLNVVSKDFVLANINSVETKDGYNYAYLTCMYDYAGNSIPTNQTITPFELSFAAEKDVALGEAKIEVFDIVLRGNDNYNLEETATKEITILPKLAEGIAITGADTIDKATEFTVTITPDYTYSKEVVWSVDDDKIAVISKDGILTPIKNGVVTITATTTDGSNISATKQVNVTAYAKIDALSIAGVWDKEFSPDVNEYIVYVKEDVNNITVEANYTAGVLFVDNVMLLPDMENDFELKENSTILTFKRNNVADMTDSEYKIKIIKFEGTKTTVTDNGTKFTVTPINIAKGNTVILALYNGDTFVEMQSKAYTGEDIPFTTDKSYTNAKVMVWNNLESMTPICDVEIVK